MHVLPSPVNPSLHVQRYDPGRLTQSAFTSQSSISLVHSLISVEHKKIFGKYCFGGEPYFNSFFYQAQHHLAWFSIQWSLSIMKVFKSFLYNTLKIMQWYIEYIRYKRFFTIVGVHYQKFDCM